MPRGKTRKIGVSRFLIWLSILGLVGGKIVMTACAGNTCRSPYAEFVLKENYGLSNTISRAVNSRNPGAPMAPLSAAASKELCRGDEQCMARVDAHKSTSFTCDEVKEIIESSADVLKIIPMDDKVADKIAEVLEDCDISSKDRSRIEVGLGCHDGVCDRKSAEIPDPFFDRGTDRERKSYHDMTAMVQQQLHNEFGRGHKRKRNKSRRRRR